MGVWQPHHGGRLNQPWPCNQSGAQLHDVIIAVVMITVLYKYDTDNYEHALKTAALASMTLRASSSLVVCIRYLTPF